MNDKQVAQELVKLARALSGGPMTQEQKDLSDAVNRGARFSGELERIADELATAGGFMEDTLSEMQEGVARNKTKAQIYRIAQGFKSVAKKVGELGQEVDEMSHRANKMLAVLSKEWTGREF